LASCAVAPAGAERGRRVEIGILGGWSRASAGVSAEAIYQRRITTQITDGSVFGLRLGGNINRFLGIEMTFANAGSDYDAYLVGQAGDTLSSVNTTSIGLFNFNALLQYPMGRVVPFVTAGAGWALFIDYSLPATDFGVGVKVLLSSRLLARLEYRRYQVNGDHTIQEAVYDDWSHSIKEYPHSYSDPIRLMETSVGISVLL
jgi:opacity protein-like surface antigen